MRDEEAYGPDYYKDHLGPVPYERSRHWLGFFGGVAGEIVRRLHPKRVFDSGCAFGLLIESLRDRGVEAWGIDTSRYAVSQARPDIRKYCSVGSVADPIAGGPYDAVTCIEVLEHVPEAQARQAVVQMTQVTDTILFSSTPEDFATPTHINVRPIVYWLGLFAKFHFYPDLQFDCSFLAPHSFLLRRRPKELPEDLLLLFHETLRSRAFLAVSDRRQDRIGQLAKLLEGTSRHLAELSEASSEMRGAIGALRDGGDPGVGEEPDGSALRHGIGTAAEELSRVDRELQSVAGLPELLDRISRESRRCRTMF